MPRFTVEDDRGNTLTLEGDSPPTESELEDIFAQHHPTQTATSESRGPQPLNWSGDQFEAAAKKMAEQEKMRRDISQGMDPGTGLTEALFHNLPADLGNVARAIPADLAAGMSLLQRKDDKTSVLDTIKENMPYAAEASGNIPAAISAMGSGSASLPIDRQLAEAASEPGGMGAAILGHTSQGLAASAPLLAVGAMPGWAVKLASLGFSADMIYHAPELFQEYADEINKPEEEQDKNKIASLQSGIIQTFAFAPLAGKHGASPLTDRITTAFDNANRLTQTGEKGYNYASQIPETAALHGNVRSQTGEAEQRGAQVPAEEGGQGIQPQTEERLLTRSEAEQQGPEAIKQIMADHGVDRDTAVAMQSRARQVHGISKEVASAPAAKTGSLTTEEQAHFKELNDKFFQGDVRPQAGEAEQSQVIPLPIEKGGQGIQPQAEERLLTRSEAEQQGPEAIKQIMADHGVDRDTAVAMQSRARQVHGISKEVASAPAAKTGSLTTEEQAHFKELNNKFFGGEDMSAEEIAALDSYDARNKTAMQQRVERQAVPDEPAQAEFEAAAKKHGYNGEVAFVDEKSMTDDDVLKSSWAIWNPKSGRIEVNRDAWNSLTPERRAKLVESVASEEAIHSKISDADAADYFRNSTGIQRAIGRRIYTAGTKGLKVSENQLAHEMLRRTIQHLRGVKPTELVELAGREGWTVKSLDAVDRAINKIRQMADTKASKAQLATLDKVQQNIGIVKKALQSGAQAAPQRNQEDISEPAKKFIEAWNNPKAKISNISDNPDQVTTIKVGSSMDRVADLDAMLDLHRKFIEQNQADRQRMLAGKMSPDEMNRFMVNMTRKQFPREVIETATNSGSNKFADRKLTEKNYPAPKLDWQKHPEVEAWLREHGSEVGIELPGQREAAAAPRRGPTKKEIQHMEELRKYKEAMGERPKQESFMRGEPAVPPEERVSASESGALPRHNAFEIEQKADQFIAGKITAKERPSFKDFREWVKNNVAQVEPHQIRDMWENAVWDQLLHAKPERLAEWREGLGLESRYGKSVIAPARAVVEKAEAERIPTATSAAEANELAKDYNHQARLRRAQDLRGIEAAQRYRNKVISAIAQKLIGESLEGRAELNRNEITVDDIDFANKKTKTGAYSVIRESDLGNPELLNKVLRDQARASSSDPESASRRLVAVVDRKTGAVELLSTYNDAGVQRVTDPAGARLTGKPSRELNKAFLRQYRPFASILLADPVKAFRQKFESVTEFSDKIGEEASGRSRVGDFPGEAEAPEDFSVEGTPGLKGEGGMFQGPYRVPSARGGALESNAPLTTTEINGVMDQILTEVGNLNSADDVRLTLLGMADKAARGKMRATDWTAANGFRKMFNALERQDKFKDMSREEILDVLADRIYEKHNTTKDYDAFVKETLAEFEGQSPEDAGPVAQGSKFSKELTMPIDRVPPTVVRPEQLPPGTELPEPRGAPKARLGASVPGEPYINQVSDAEFKAQMDAMHAMGREYGVNQDWAVALGERERAARLQYAKAKNIRERTFEKQGVLMSPEQAIQAAKLKAGVKTKVDLTMRNLTRMAEESLSKDLRTTPPEPGYQGEPSASLRRSGSNRTVGELISHALSDTFSIYDKWMSNRIAEYGGPASKVAAGMFNQMISREKQLYGMLTPLLDRARRLAGGVESARATTIGGKIAELPQRAAASLEARKAVSWMDNVRQVTPRAGRAITVDAIEGNIGIPRFAQNVVDAAKAANMEIGLMLQPVIPGFRAGGKFQRNMTSLGYDIIRQGGGKMWEDWTEALARTNRQGQPLGPVLAEVRSYFKKVKEELDAANVSGATLEKINQDMARKYPNVITHLKGPLGSWQPVIHADLFNYLENAARRATHVRAFREQFPATDAGRKDFHDMIEQVKTELPDEAQRDLQGLVRALHGHPTDDYSGGWQDYLRMGPQQAMGTGVRMLNQTMNNIMAKLVLSGQMFVQPGEVVAGSTPVFLGYDNYLRAAAKYRQLYPIMELEGSVNRVMYDYTFNPNAPLRSLFRITGNVISKATAQNALNELQEGMAAATARVVSERIVNRDLSPWEQTMLPQTFKIMGFTPGEAQRMMAGDAELLGQFQRRAAAFLTGGNKSVAEGSRLGANRLFNSIFRFQTYPMIKTAQARSTLVNLVDAWRSGTPMEKAAASRLAGRFFFGNAAQGALTVGLTALAYGGLSGLKVKMHEAEDEPGKFLAESFLSSISGPAYLLWRGKSAKGLAGYGEQAARMAFPYAVMNDLNDMAYGFGQYKDRDTFSRIGMFLGNKTPATKAIGTGLAMFGLANESQPLEQAIQGFSRWRREELGFSENRDYLQQDERQHFRMEIKKAIDAMRVGDQDKFNQAWMDAVMESGDIGKVKQSLNQRKILKGPDGKSLTEEQKESLQKRIGMDAYDRLEWYDLMLDRAADGVLLPAQ